MIIVEMRGGLGNQMFQYALGKTLSILHGVPLKLDISNYTHTVGDPKKGIRLFGLSYFNIHAPIASKEDVKKFRVYFLQNIFGKVMRYINSWGEYYTKSYIVEPPVQYFNFDEKMFSVGAKKDVYISGYWQNPAYFEKYAELLRKEFVVVAPAEGKNLALLESVKNQNAVAIHVRHGDNANGVAQNHGVLPLEFYTNAISIIKEKVFNPAFYLFSDDTVWAKEQFSYVENLTVVDWNGDEKNYEDMRLMSSCKHHIIANSTFSWWGAWLAGREGQIVIAPKKYHQVGDQSYTTYYPAHWNII